MKKLITLLCLALSIALLPDKVCAQTFSLSENEEAAEDGSFLAQINLGELYLSGSSDKIFDYPSNVANGIKAEHYYLMAVDNPESGGKADSLKVICMAHLSLLHKRGNEIDKRFETNSDKAFYWAYSCLRHGGSVNLLGEKMYQFILGEAISGLLYAASADERFVSEYMYLVDQLQPFGIFAFWLLMDYHNSLAKEKGYTRAESLNLETSRGKNGNYMYIGETVDGRAHGAGILLCDAYEFYGDFTNGVRNGKGHCSYKSDGTTLIGEWKDGKIYNGGEYGHFDELKKEYKNGKLVYPIPQSLRIGELDSRGDTIPSAKDISLSVRWAEKLMGENEANSVGDLYHWGATNPEHKYQSADASQPNYLPRSACLAIYGGVERQSDIVGTGYDAPHCLWSKSWRMPTVAEMKELVTKCDIEVKANSGEVVLRRGEERFNGSFVVNIPHSPDGYGIWTGSIDPEDNNKAYALILDEKTKQLTIQSRDRECEFAILPVTDVPFYKSHLYRIP